MTDPTDPSLRAAIERVYDQTQQRKAAPGRAVRKPLKPLRHEISRLQDRERFIALCQREWAEEDRWKRDAAEASVHGYVAKTTAPRGLVKEWVEEYRTKVSAAASGIEARFSFLLNCLPYVVALAQGEGGLDLREETVRRLLGGGTFDESVMRGQLRRLGTRARADALQRVILPIVKADPTITAGALLVKLNYLAGPGNVIASVRPKTIEWERCKGVVGLTPVEDLKQRLYRAKKALKHGR